MTEILQSLSAFCKAHEIPKSSASRKLKESGFDTADGLNSEAIAKLRELYGLDQAKQYSQIATIGSKSLSFSAGAGWDELFETMGSDVQQVEGEFVEDIEDNETMIATNANRQLQFDDLEDMQFALRGRAKAARHFQIQEDEYQAHMLHLHQQKVMANSKSAKNRQASRQQAQKPKLANKGA